MENLPKSIVGERRAVPARFLATSASTLTFYRLQKVVDQIAANPKSHALADFGPEAVVDPG